MTFLCPYFDLLPTHMPAFLSTRIRNRGYTTNLQASLKQGEAFIVRWISFPKRLEQKQRAIKKMIGFLIGSMTLREPVSSNNNAGPEFQFNPSTSFMINFDPSRDEQLVNIWITCGARFPRTMKRSCRWTPIRSASDMAG